MSFLAPLFLAGAAAVGLPILFHLIRRSTREKIPFSSLMFLEASPPRITKRSRLEHWFLLLLRCAVICLLALAFARPFWQRPLPAAPVDARAARVAILVDTSASMRREDLWEQAQQRVGRLVRDLADGDAVAVYLFDQRLRPIFNFADSSRLPPRERAAVIASALRQQAPGWAGTQLGPAMIQAAELLLEELNRDTQEQGGTPLRLVVVSDFQSGAKLNGLQGFEWPRNFRVQLEPIEARELANASVQIIEEARGPFAAVASVSNWTARVRVSNAAESKSDQFSLRWPTSAAAAGDPARVYVPAGQSRIVAAPAAPAGSASLELTGDSVAFDNIAHVVRPATAETSIAYWGTEAAADPKRMRYYLHRAFEQTNLATRVLVLSNAVPEAARSASLLILGAAPSEPAMQLAREMLSAGRSVLVPLQNSATANVVSELLEGVLVTAPEANVRDYALFGSITFQHPLFAPFSDARFGDFTKIRFWKHRALNLANVTNATVIARLDSGDPLLAELPASNGRVLVLASTWAPADSQLALSSKFVPLLFGMLEQSANLRAKTHQYLVGEPVVLPPEFRGEVILPNGEKQPAVNPSFADTAEPGIYQAGAFQFAVNIDPAEGKLAPWPREEFASLGVPLEAAKTAADPDWVAARQANLLATETESRQKLWRNLLLGALIFVLLEAWLAGRLSRVPAPQA